MYIWLEYIFLFMPFYICILPSSLNVQYLQLFVLSIVYIKMFVYNVNCHVSVCGLFWSVFYEKANWIELKSSTTVTQHHKTTSRHIWISTEDTLSFKMTYDSTQLDISNPKKTISKKVPHIESSLLGEMLLMLENIFKRIKTSTSMQNSVA